MVCAHLAELESALQASGARETYRGQAWSENCREWVYFDVVLDVAALQQRFHLDTPVRLHDNLDPKSGLERGFECTECQDAILGLVSGDRVYR